MNAINDEFNFILTGSNGWISRNFISQIKINYPSANIYEINRKNGLESIEQHLTKNNIYLIHNVFTRAENLIKDMSEKQFKSESNKNLRIIENFLKNSNTSGFYYPSSGSIYKLRKKDKNVYKPYSDQKIFEEDFYSNLCESRNINFVMPRIFSSIGPFINNPYAFPISSFIIQSLTQGKIEIQSKNNNLYSFCSLSTLSRTVIQHLVQDIKEIEAAPFDAVDYNFNLYDIAIKVAEMNSIKDKDIYYDFDDKNVEEYIGEPSKYQRLKANLNIKNDRFEQELLILNEYIKECYI
jgi:hypothetical protein